MKRALHGLKSRAQALQLETRALILAWRDPRTPLHVRVWIALVLAYALSPIDLIPDFIPVLGYLDDLILVPAGIALALKMIPTEVMQEARLNARRTKPAAPMLASLGMLGMSIILVIWILIAAWFIWRFIPLLSTIKG